MIRFLDRHEAGRKLAQDLLRYADQRPAVFALPRGGVPIGYEIAKALRAPLDLILVRKIGVPFQPELAAGAVVDGDEPQVVLNPTVVEPLRLSEAFLKEETDRKLVEIEERRHRRHCNGRYDQGGPARDPPSGASPPRSGRAGSTSRDSRGTPAGGGRRPLPRDARVLHGDRDLL
jgi:predicted phosphoribosyltransferase